MSELNFIPEWSNLKKMFERGVCDVLEINVFGSLEEVSIDYQGNYLFFDDNGECLYVGESSDVGKRVKEHLNCWKKNKPSIEKYTEDESNPVTEEMVKKNPWRFGSTKGIGVDSVLDLVEFVVTIRNYEGEAFEKLLIKELDPPYNENTYLPKPNEKNPDCPECGNKLYWRRRERGYVCKNWRCDNYHKLGKGRVFDKNGNMKRETVEKKPGPEKEETYYHLVEGSEK